MGSADTGSDGQRRSGHQHMFGHALQREVSGALASSQQLSVAELYSREWELNPRLGELELTRALERERLGMPYAWGNHTAFGLRMLRSVQ